VGSVCPYDCRYLDSFNWNISNRASFNFSRKTLLDRWVRYEVKVVIDGNGYLAMLES
jgi:hypothetical protein